MLVCGVVKIQPFLSTEPMTAVRMYKSPHYTEQGKVDTDSAHGSVIPESLSSNASS